MPRSDTQVLQLVRERKLAELIPLPHMSRVLEASGVIVRGRDFVVVFDNVRRAAQIGPDLVPDTGRHRWLGRLRDGEGYEDIAYSPDLRRYYLLLEAEKHPDGTYKGIVEEFDERWQFKGQAWVDFPFQKRNTGFEGLEAVRVRGVDYLLALCEGNLCKAGRKGRQGGGGRIQVLRKIGKTWQATARINLPETVDFEDYSALALHGDRLAVTSQVSSKLWLGKVRLKDWNIVGAGRTYDFPRTRKGKRLYCTIEGVDWLSDDTFVTVSDLRKRDYPGRCDRTDQSIHIFKLPKAR